MSGRIKGLSLSVALVMVAVLLPTSSMTAAADNGLTADNAGRIRWACDSSIGVETSASFAPERDFAPDQILVRFRPALSAGRADEILAGRGLSRLRHIRALGVHVLRLPPGLSVEQAVEIFSHLPEVEFAEPNYILHAAVAPGDEIVDEFDQWALSKVQAVEAWDYIADAVEGDPPPVLLATVDTGIDQFHPDLAGNIWRNPGEIAGSDGVDDDGNGYIDDTWGWDFVNGDNDPFDDNMHGTAVSSVEAAVRDGFGMAGLCPWCKLVAVKVLGADGSGTLDGVADGIVYATDIGAKVINLSMVASAGSQSLEDAVNYAWSHGTLVVAAAGNHGTEQVMWPAAYENAMSIASTNEQDYRSCFSGYSEGYISVGAPGEAILTADLSEEGYHTYSGTSLSAPYVTGLAGLLFSLNPASTVAGVRSIIEGTAEDLGPVGTDAFFGTGRINALRAVEGDTTPTTPPTGMFATEPEATGYAHARKLARDVSGTLHWVWHGQDGGQYQVLYATSSDDGGSWSEPQVVFESSAETYYPALALDGSHVYVVFPSKHDSSYYRVFFSSKPLSGDWSVPVPVPDLGGSYDAVRPDLHLDPSSGRLHLVASSLDDGPSVYYTRSDDGGVTWSTASSVAVGQNTRYADVHAFGSHVYIAGRTVEWVWFVFTEIPRYRVFTIRSLDDGNTWQDLAILATHDGLTSGEYGLSLAGVEDRLYLAYEHSGTIRFRTSLDGATWSERENLGNAKWPSLTQADDGQAWVMWEKDDQLVLRHYSGSIWEPEETLGKGSYPNLKLGIGGDLVEWVTTHCSGAPFRLMYGSRALDVVDIPPSVAVVDPVEGQTVSGGYRVLVDASDDSAVTLVELSIDGGAFADITANFDGNYYFYDWVTTAYADGNHTLQARATDDGAQTTDSLPVNVSVDNQPPPSSPPFPETGIVSDVGSSGWTTVNLSHDYGDSMVVVASANYDDTGAPGVVRIRNASGNSFEVRVDCAGSSAISGVTVYYLVVEEGVYTEAEHGVKMEAVKFQSMVTDYPHSFVGESRSYSNSYTNPVVVGQVMTYNDARFSTFWSRGSNRNNPPSSTELHVGKHVGEDPDKTRADDVIGYIVIEAGSGSMGAMSYLADLGGDTVEGMSDNPPFSYGLSGLSTASIAIVSQAAMDGSNGGWAVLYGANPLTASSLNLAIDEDQMKDSERSHSTEQVAYLVFGAMSNIPPSVAVVDPVEGQAVSGGYRVLVDASDDSAVTLVELSIDGGVYVDITANFDGNYYFYDWVTSSYADGNHTLQARATDDDAQTTDSTPVNVSVDNVSDPPSVTVVDPVEGQTVSGGYRVLVDASDDSAVTLVELSIDGGAFADITANFDGNYYFYDWVTTAYADGNHTLQARATDDDAQTTDSLPVNVNVDNQLPPSSPPFPETGIVSDAGNSEWTTVNLSHDYDDRMVVVASANYDDSSPAGVVRIRNASGSSFDVRVDNTDGTSAISDVTVHYLVIEEGVYTEAEHGVKMEAVKFLSTVTDYPYNWSGESRSYSNSYSQPVVLGQVMTYADTRFSAFWACGPSRDSPPSSTDLYVGKHVGEDPDRTRADEVIGYIVIEAGSGSMGSVSYTADLGGDTVQGVDDSPPYSYPLSGLSSASIAIVSQAAMDGKGNGSWAILYGANPVTVDDINLAVDEDQANDPERSHTSEQVAYIVFE